MIRAAECESGLPPIVEMRRGGLEVFDDLAGEWQRLCGEGPCNEPYHRPEWITAYVRAFSPSARIVVLIARINDRIKAILPFIEEKGRLFGLPIKKLRTLTEAHWWRTEVIRGAGSDGDKAVSALWGFLKKLRDWDILEMRMVPRHGGADALFNSAGNDGFKTRRVEYSRSPYITLSRLVGKEEPIGAARSGNLRHALKKIMRKVDKQGGLELQRRTKAEPELLQCFYDMEYSGWKGRRGITAIGDPGTRKFCDEIASAAGRFDYLRIYLLKFKEHIIASHFGFACGNRYFFFKLAVDEKYHEYAPGHLSVNAVLADCLECGLDEFDFTGYGDDWKLKWTDEVRAHDFLYVFSRGFYGRLLYAIKFPGNPFLFKIIQAARLIFRPIRALLNNNRRSGDSHYEQCTIR